MNIKPIPQIVTQNEFTYHIQAKKSSILLLKGFFEGKHTNYEVHILGVRSLYNHRKTDVEDIKSGFTHSEYLNDDESFGEMAWCYHANALDQAKAKFNKLTKKEKVS